MREGRLIWLMVAMAMALGACAGARASDESTTTAAADTTEASTTTTEAVEPSSTTTMAVDDAGHHGEGEADPEAVHAALLATSGFQDLAVAEAAGYGSTIDALGCFENADKGGMGLHYLNEGLMDDVVDVATPEALVYELDHTGEIVGLVAHEYIVPLEAWTSEEPPELFGLEFHQHSVLPLWILHAWIWKDNPAGTFVDYNPKVRMCPDGVPIFGVDLP